MSLELLLTALPWSIFLLPWISSRICIYFRVAESLCDMMGPIFFNVALTCIIVIACSLFVIESNDSLSFEIIVALLDMFSLVGLIFAYFYLSERITTNLMDIGNIFYHSAWDRLSIRQQGLLILPLQRAQREFRLRSVGLFDCSLPVFSSVWNFLGFIKMECCWIVRFVWLICR